MTYRASLDSTSKSITLAVILLILGSAVVPILIDLAKESFRLDYLAAPLLIIALSAGLLLLCHAFSPQSYTLTQDRLIINRAIKPPVFKLDEITNIELLQKAALWTAIRTFGVGGLFGYYGKCWHHQYGHITLYATRSDNKILISFKNNSKIVITPDTLEMLDELRKKIRSQF